MSQMTQVQQTFQDTDTIFVWGEKNQGEKQTGRFGGGGGSGGGLVLIFGLGVAGVDDLGVVLVDESDESLRLQLLQGKPRQRTANLQPLRDDGRGDQLIRGNLFVQFVVGRCKERRKGSLLFSRRTSLERPGGGILIR